ncbi:hypothetical protein ED312_13685 [Sinomicrobium pectinilyticum]|uniref:Uncharacterized protein n=1 Tax=Sinomicrobium pectinilyticum TaxID=1084421 RepID=A0A3N0E9H2_SINP1|nr:hypothetical protein [Sinomicrobium pectinilyticum]RNL84477.1 hypothetical protein ED312_13685 [Sinomicrobium pectinilyticum]
MKNIVKYGKYQRIQTALSPRAILPNRARKPRDSAISGPSGQAGQVKRELELLGMAIIDVDTHAGFHLDTCHALTDACKKELRYCFTHILQQLIKPGRALPNQT